MLVIPAIDLRGGRCVRLIQGDYANERVYDQDPATVAASFADQGARLIHVVDLDGAQAGEPQNWASLAAIVRAAKVPVEVGGGVRSLDIARRLFDIGIDRVIVGTKLVQDEELAAAFFGKFGAKVIAGIDARDGLVATVGWTEATQMKATDLAKQVARQGAARIILTDIAHDGMLDGANLRLLRDIKRASRLPVIHSGGIGSLEDLRRCLLAQPEGVIIGRALYEGRFTLTEALSIF